MDNDKKLVLVRSIHSAIWLIMAAASFYVLYAGITDTRSIWLWLAIGLLVLETAVLLVNRWTCPLTPLATRYTDDRSANFDIYLPLWLARFNKHIFGTIFVVGLVLVFFRILSV